MPFTNGIDVSHHNEAVNWAAAAATGIQFAYAKATEGATVTDIRFRANWDGISAAGLMRGAYHFFHPATPPQSQSDHFLAVLGSLSAGDLPPALDLEETSQTNDEWPRIAAPSRIGLILKWLEAVEDATAMKPVIYTRRGWIHDFLPGAEALSAYPLWVADYGSHDEPLIPAQWANWTFWQFGEHGSVAGVGGDVDLDRFNGTLEELRLLGKGAARGATT
jgi:lysozyme